MANNFFNDSNKAYSENLNDGILVGNAFDWTVDVSLPTDTGGVFPNSSTIVMAKVADVSITPNSNLSIGSTISNSSGSSQVYRLTVYPNFNRFGGFKSISLTADSGVTFYIANKGGTSPIANNLDYDDLSNVPELKVLKEYDIVITIPSNKEVTGLEFVFQSSGASVSASLLQSNVTGLNNTISSIQNKNTQQDNRLSDLETVNAQILTYELYSNNYNPSIDNNITVTCTCKNVLGNPINNKTLELFQNGTSVGTSTTNANGIATWTVTCDEWGLQDFRVANANIQVKVGGYRTTYPHTYYALFEHEDKVGLRISISENINFTTSWRFVNDSVIPYRLRPIFPVTMVGLNATTGQQNIAFGVRESADHTKVEIIVKSLTDSTISTNLYNYIEWSKV